MTDATEGTQSEQGALPSPSEGLFGEGAGGSPSPKTEGTRYRFIPRPCGLPEELSSSRKKAVRGQREGVKAKAAKKAAGPSRPAGAVPKAQVVARHGLDTVTRLGRGFSLGELEGAGLPEGLAREWEVRVDYRRRSVLDENVSALKVWSSHRPAVKERGEVQKVEAELEKVAEEIEEGAKEAAEIVVKAGREVEKEAKKVEKGAAKAEKKVRDKAKPRAKSKK